MGFCLSGRPPRFRYYTAALRFDALLQKTPLRENRTKLQTPYAQKPQFVGYIFVADS